MGEREIKVALVGQPNVGKSYLINSIAGATLHVGNFAGVTVDKKEVTFERDGYKLRLIDLPGIYSLHPYTPEEEVTKRYLLEGDYDLILNVVDSNQLEKSLTLSFQLMDLQKPMVIAFNMFDEFKKHGGDIDIEKIERFLNIRAEKVSAKEQFGLEELFQKVIETHKLYLTPYLTYSDVIEEEIDHLIPLLVSCDRECHLKPRFIAIRLLEGDDEIYRFVRNLSLFVDLLPILQKSRQRLKAEYDEEDTRTIFFEERLALAKGLITQTVTRAKKETLTEKIDKILIHPVLGLPIFLGVMWLLFQLTFKVGSLPVELIGKGFDQLGEKVAQWLPPSPFTDALTDGVIPAVGTVVAFLPNILILFLGLNLIEQTGYMARAAYVMDGILKKFGLQGRSFIPLVSGFGCSVPAYMAARTLKNPKDRLITMLIIGFMSCGARLPIYVLLVSAFFPPAIQGDVMFIIYLGGALVGLIVAKILREILFKGEPEPFVMELPKYRFPKLKGILLDLWVKTKLYLKKAGTFIAVASFAIWFLSNYPKYYPNLPQQVYYLKEAGVYTPTFQVTKKEQLEHSYLAHIGKAISPIFEPLGLSWREGVALLAGLSAKEVVVSTLAVLYNEKGGSQEELKQHIRKSLTLAGAVAMIIFIIFYSPCVAAMGTFWSEVPQWQWRLFYTIYPNVLAWLLAFIGYRLTLYFTG
jgi:ferrous iron transport protein B